MSKNDDATAPVLVPELSRYPTVVYRPAENPGQGEEAAA